MIFSTDLASTQAPPGVGFLAYIFRRRQRTPSGAVKSNSDNRDNGCVPNGHVSRTAGGGGHHVMEHVEMQELLPPKTPENNNCDSKGGDNGAKPSGWSRYNKLVVSGWSPVESNIRVALVQNEQLGRDRHGSPTNQYDELLVRTDEPVGSTDYQSHPFADSDSYHRRYDRHCGSSVPQSTPRGTSFGHHQRPRSSHHRTNHTGVDCCSSDLSHSPHTASSLQSFGLDHRDGMDRHSGGHASLPNLGDSGIMIDQVDSHQHYHQDHVDCNKRFPHHRNPYECNNSAPHSHTDRHQYHPVVSPCRTQRTSS